MKTVTIELDDEVFEMLSASAARMGLKPEDLASVLVEHHQRNEQHVIWDVDYVAGPAHRGFRRGDVVEAVGNGTRGLVIDATEDKVRVAVQRGTREGFAVGSEIAGPAARAVVTKAAPVEGLRVYEHQIFQTDLGCFDRAA